MAGIVERHLRFHLLSTAVVFHFHCVARTFPVQRQVEIHLPFVMGRPSIPVTTSPPSRILRMPRMAWRSPPRSPAVAAGPPGVTRSISNPSLTGKCSASATVGVSKRASTPMEARRTRPSVIKSCAICRAVLMGIAKPMPAVVPDGV